MTRINDVAKIVEPYLDDRHGEPEAKALHIARALDAAGHLLPDLPEPDANDGIWYLHQDVIVHNGVGPCVCIEDDYQIHVFKPEEGRAVAYALLAAADYAEGHANDQ